jgi:pimeloyl-ACP methyl ester carboxylesterase
MCATSGGGAPVADPAVLVRDGRGMVARLPEPDRLPNWLSEADLSRYARAFSVTGFRGPLNWYRSIDRNWELTELLAEAKITVPALFVTGEHDVVRMMSPDSVMDGWVTDLRRTVIVEGAGHWVQQERPDAVNSALVAFLDAVSAD